MATAGFIHSIGVSYKNDAGSIASTTSTVTGDQELNYDSAVAAGAVNAHVVASILHATLLSVCLYSDQAVTIKTNSTSSPEETITLAAKQQIAWNNLSTGACPFSGDITALYISNPGTVVANVKVRTLSNI